MQLMGRYSDTYFSKFWVASPYSWFASLAWLCCTALHSVCKHIMLKHVHVQGCLCSQQCFVFVRIKQTISIVCDWFNHFANFPLRISMRGFWANIQSVSNQGDVLIWAFLHYQNWFTCSAVCLVTDSKTFSNPFCRTLLQSWSVLFEMSTIPQIPYYSVLIHQCCLFRIFTSIETPKRPYIRLTNGMLPTCCRGLSGRSEWSKSTFRTLKMAQTKIDKLIHNNENQPKAPQNKEHEKP